MIADIVNGLMALPNLIALLALSPVIIKESKQYLRNKKTQIARSGFSCLFEIGSFNSVFLLASYSFGDGGEEHICRRVEGCFARVLDDPDDKADADDLHGQIIGDAKEATSNRDEKERSSCNSRCSTSRDSRYHTQNERSSKVNLNVQGIGSS